MWGAGFGASSASGPHFSVTGADSETLTVSRTQTFSSSGAASGIQAFSVARGGSQTRTASGLQHFLVPEQLRRLEPIGGLEPLQNRNKSGCPEAVECLQWRHNHDSGSSVRVAIPQGWPSLCGRASRARHWRWWMGAVGLALPQDGCRLQRLNNTSRSGRPQGW